MKESRASAVNNQKSGSSSDFPVKCLCGGSLIEHKPIFDPKADIVYVVQNDRIRMYSTETGEFIRELDDNKEGTIVGLHINQENMKSLIACTINGAILTWKIDSLVLLYKVKLNLSSSFTVHRFVLTSVDGEPHGIICFKDERKLFQLALVELKKGKIVQHYQIPFLNQRKEVKVRLADGHAGSNFFVAVQKQIVYVVDKTSSNFIAHNNQTAINVVLCHPEEEMIATGDVMGRIKLWRNIFSKNPVKAELHWHHMLVLSLAFSQSGTILYSGGAECVLVKWEIKEKSIEKEFLPRLSGSIKQISVDPRHDKITICTDDNAIQIVNSNLTPLRSIQDFTQASLYDLGHSDPFPAGIKTNPKTHQLVMNGRIGYLQFFSTKTMKLLFNVDISMRNVVPRQKKINVFSTQVTHVAFSGSWMATVESWNDRVNSPDSRMKFWKFVEDKQTYKLHTQIEQAHQKEILSLEFSKESLCASTGLDHLIKIWSLEKSGLKSVWLCIDELSYKNLPVRHVCFSQDSSLIAAGFGNVLCVWDTVEFQLKCALSAPAVYDGSTNRVLFSLPGKKSKGIAADALDKRRKMIELMKSVIDKTGSEQIVKNLTLQKKERFFSQKKVNKATHRNLSKAEKESIFRRVLSLSDLTFNQKIQVLHKLHIYYKISNRVEQEVVDFIKRNLVELKDLYKGLQRNIGRVRNHEKFKSQWRFRMWNSLSSKRNRNFVSVRKFLTRRIDNKQLEIKKAKEKSTENLLPIKNLTHITNVVFCQDEFSHLAVVTTAEKLLVWNLLTLKLQGSFKIHTKSLAFDPLTNLIAVFTRYNELFVVHPSPALTIHHQKNIPDIYGAVWVPRDTPLTHSMNVNWQATSQLLFLNHRQEICTLKMPSDEDFGTAAPFIDMSNGIAVNTPFAAMIAQRINEETTKDASGVTKRVGIAGTGAVKDIINLSSHAMPPIRLLSKEFIGSMLSSQKPSKLQRVEVEKEITTMEISDDENEDSTQDLKMMRRKELEREEKEMRELSRVKKLESMKNIESRVKNLRLETLKKFEF